MNPARFMRMTVPAGAVQCLKRELLPLFAHAGKRALDAHQAPNTDAGAIIQGN